MFKYSITFNVFSLALLLTFSLADASADLLKDLNKDGMVVVTAFGDSITYGIGDRTQPGQYLEEAPFPGGPIGYPSRVSNQLGIVVDNKGDPGETLTDFGSDRFAAAVQDSASDIVLIMEGVNDATLQRNRNEYSQKLQKVINISIALGKLPLLMTLTPPCCIHSGTRPIARSFSDIVRSKAEQNDLTIIDIEKAWDLTCDGPDCYLYVLPEGLHPNSVGYDLIAQTIMATLLDIDIFSSGGASQLESALSLEPGSVIVKPEEILMSTSE